MRRPLLLTAATAAAVLALTGCSDAPEPGDEQATGEDAATEEPTEPGTELPTVEAGFGEAPEIQFPGTGAPEELQVEVLEEGDGTEVGAGDFVVANYQGRVWDGEVFDSSFDRGGPTGFSLDSVIQGWQQGLTGTQVGDRVLLSIPPELGYGDTGTPDGSVAPGDTLVFVVDVVESYSPEAAAVEPAPDLPVTVDGELGEPASVTVTEGAEEPTEHSAHLLATGTGAEVPAEGAEVHLHYAVTVWDNSAAESTWEMGRPLSYTTPSQTYFDELIGMPVGSRAVLLVAAEDDQPAMAAVVDIIGLVPTE